MLCILYVNLVGTCLALVGLLFERWLPATFPRRSLWSVIIPISLILPGLYRAHHSWSVTQAFEQQQSLQPALGNTIGTASLTLLDPRWWTRVQNYDTDINRLWLIVSGMLLLWALINAMRVSHLVSVSRREQDLHVPSAIDGVSVVVTDIAGPATVGFWRSRVVVPRWVLALPGVQRKYVLRHEEEHRRAHDGRLLFAASLPLILMPWNLAMWWQLRRLVLAVEVDCDHRVVAALGDANAYGQLLLRVAEAANRGPRLQPAFLGGSGMLERRLTELLARAPLRNVQKFLLPAAVLVLLLVVVWMPHPVLGHGSHEHTMKAGASTSARQH
ncbi:MAG: M56 family metallopeptidase [Gemmatimonadaceae bacterium]